MPNSKSSSFKLGETVNYVKNPVMIFAEAVTIKYLGSTPWIPATTDHVALSGTTKFEVIATNGKSFPLDWSSGTGLVPGPSYFITDKGCYELHISFGGLTVKESAPEKCGSWAKDLR